MPKKRVAMKARVEKKLSKRLAELLPSVYRKAWRERLTGKIQ